MSQSTPLQTAPLPPPPAPVIPPQGLVNMPSSTQLVVPTRQPLSEVFGNGPSAARKRFKQGKTELEESLELAPF